MNLSTVLVISAICAGVGALIAQAKHIPAWEGALAGALFGPIGAAVMLFATARLPKAPIGLRAVKCPQCLAVQNVAEAAPAFTCWRCAYVARLVGV